MYNPLNLLRLPGVAVVKNLPANVQETQVPSLGREGSLEKEMAIHSSILALKIPWTEELVGYIQVTNGPWFRANLWLEHWVCICFLWDLAVSLT